MNNFESAVQSVKATLFDSVYREQGLVEILTKKMNTFSPDKQVRLGTLFTKQKEDIEKVLNLLDEFGIKMNDVLATSKEIMEISNEQEAENAVVVENGNVMQEVVSPTVENTSTPEASVPVVEDSPVTAEVGGVLVDAATAEVVPNVSDETNVSISEVADVGVATETSIAQGDVTLTDNVNNVEENKPGLSAESEISIPGVLVDATSIGGEQVTAPISAEPGVITGSEVVSQPAMEIPGQEINQNVQGAVPMTPTVDVGVVSESANVPTAVNAVVDAGVQPTDVVAPVSEVIQIPGQTGAIEDSVSETVPTAGFVLSPIDEDVVPTPPVQTEEKKEMTAEAGIDATNQQLNAINAVKEEIANNPTLTADEKTEALEKYSRLTANVVKAILVTKAQYEKLAASKVTQKALLIAKQSGSGAVLAVIPETVSNVPVVTDQSVAPVANAQTDEQTFIANGLLEPTVQDKQKEMQAMMEQANTLYKEGKTQEAQELFNKVSVMNKELQAGSGGQALVKS